MILTVFIYIAIYSLNVCNARILSKQEVLNIRSNYYISYYCKGDICASTTYSYLQQLTVI